MEYKCSVNTEIAIILDDATIIAKRAQQTLDMALEDFVIDDNEKPAVASAQMQLKLLPEIVQKQVNKLVCWDAEQKRLAWQVIFGGKEKGSQSSQDFEPNEAA